ncbi:MAG: amidase [Pseudomonadota bacterium]
MTALYELTASEAAHLVREKKISSYELTSACLERIAAREDTIHAWQLVDYEGALATAKRADNTDEKDGLLFGIPVGLKDIIDTADLPTTYGSKAFADHQPQKHADCVKLLKDAGAIVIGKTVTTEFAFFAPGPTVNPHNHAHTPGGSSSGSAAALADCHVPLTLGTQTAGSIIRPASFNGIYGFKPSYKSYSNQGVHPLAPGLDTLGSFARSTDDLQLLDGVLRGRAAIELSALCPKKVAIVRTPYWDQAESDMHNAFNAFVHLLEESGVKIFDAENEVSDLDTRISRIVDAQILQIAIEARDVLAPIAEKYGDLIRRETIELIKIGENAPSDAEAKVTTAKAVAEKTLNAIFTNADMILTPGALGVAPAGIAATGDPIFNRPWTFAHVPCINIPVAKDNDGLPLGVQLVGAFNDDKKLLAHAKFCGELASYNMAPPN